MSAVSWIHWVLVIYGAAFYQQVRTESSVPDFAGPISSLTVATGRDAVLKCVVDNLGDYRVAWIHVDKQTLLTIHTHVITRNRRVGVSHHNFRTWLLHLRNVQPEDSGYYMCQINTQPMKSQVGYLDIVVPPEFVNDIASRNVSVMENANVSLSCRAVGNPIPKIKWRREDGQPINTGQQQVTVFDGEELNLVRVSRHVMGAYLCIASNGVPPAISRRMYVDVTFPPMIWISNQLVGAPEGNTVTLECHTEAHPVATNFWIRDGMVIGTSNDKYETSLSSNGYKIHMKLIVKDLQTENYGVYRCVSKNALGETEGSVNLYKLKYPSSFSRKPAASPAASSDETDTKIVVGAEGEKTTKKDAAATSDDDDVSLQQQGTELNVGHSTDKSSTFSASPPLSVVMTGVWLPFLSVRWR